MVETAWLKWYDECNDKPAVAKGGENMKENDGKEIRMDVNGMLLCKAFQKDNGDYNLVQKNGKKEDMMTMSSFLSKVYGKPVTIIVR